MVNHSDENRRKAHEWLIKVSNEQARQSGNEGRVTQDEIKKFADKIAENADRTQSEKRK